MKFHEISLQFIQGFSNVEISKHYNKEITKYLAYSCLYYLCKVLLYVSIKMKVEEKDLSHKDREEGAKMKT